MNEPPKIPCPTCPVCGEPPQLIVSVLQAFCGNEDCPAFCWDMTMTKNENLDNVSYHDISHLNPEQP